MMNNKNSMAYGVDAFKLNRRAVLRTTQGWDCTRETKISGFVAKGTQPVKTNIRVVFEVDNELWYFGNDGLTKYPYHGELDDILMHGNTITELLAVEGVIQWTKKKIFPIIALDAPRDSLIMPQIQLGLKVECNLDEYQRNELSPVLNLKGNPARIINITAEKDLKGYARADIFVRLKNLAGWTDWLDLNDAQSKAATALQFKTAYTLTTLDGTDKARAYNFKVLYSTDTENTAANVVEIYLKPQKYEYDDLKKCYTLIKHTSLVDAGIECDINFAQPPLTRKNILIGKGTGALQTYWLGLNGGIDRNINPSSLRITAGNINVVNFYYDMENATVQFIAENDAEIRASYEYEIDAENWLPMAGALAQSYNDEGLYFSRFLFRLSAYKDKKISAVRFRLKREVGNVIDSDLGAATGYEQTFLLPHRALKETVRLGGKCSYQYDEETQILKVVGVAKEDLKLSYDWVGELPLIKEFVAGWTP